MSEQIYKIEKVSSFEPKQVFECGQCFRWEKEEDDSYTGVFGNHVMNVKKEKDTITFTGLCDGNIQDICYDYFDLGRDYETMKNTLSAVDESTANSISYGSGIRLLNQDLWETLVSFVISANNNIPRIKKIIGNLSRQYGMLVEWRGKTYYTFPTPKQLEKVTLQEYREMGLGFRDKYLLEIVRKVCEKEGILESLAQIQDTNELRQKLMEFPGVGEKVADCVLLFSNLKRLEAFPVDVWVRRVMKELYFPEIEESKLDKKQIQELAHQKYQNLAGIAQQYLFYWKREA